MQMNRGWAALRTALTVVALGAFASTQAMAAAAGSGDSSGSTPSGLKNIFTYSTSGQIDPSAGVTGANVISFDSIPLKKTADTQNSFMTPTSFSLGAFRVGALPEGQMTTYTDTPFSITFMPQNINGEAITGNSPPIVLGGVLNGTVGGSGQSDVIAMFLPADDPTTPNVDESAKSFLTSTAQAQYKNSLRILSDKVALVPSSSYDGLTTVQGQVISGGSPIPEPTTIALFLTAAAGLGLRRRIGRKTA